jgi:hypothetical protein
MRMELAIIYKMVVAICELLVRAAMLYVAFLGLSDKFDIFTLTYFEAFFVLVAVKAVNLGGGK